MLKHFLKRAFQTSFNISRWMALSEWTSLAQYLSAFTKWQSLMPSKRKRINEDFLGLVQKFNLSEADLLKRQQWFKRLSKIWLSFCGITLIYGFYLIIAGAWLSSILVAVLEIMMLSQAFQYHFWSFQIEKRRCGCSLKEWRLFTFGTWSTQ